MSNARTLSERLDAHRCPHLAQLAAGSPRCTHVDCDRAATDKAYGFEWCRGHLFTAHQWRMSA
jgi:hypothetical protein